MAFADAVKVMMMGEINEGRGLSILIDVGEGMTDGEGFGVPIYTYRNFRRKSGLTVEGAIQELGRNEYAELGVQIPEELITDCVCLPGFGAEGCRESLNDLLH